jgi:predicted kinase
LVEGDKKKSLSKKLPSAANARPALKDEATRLRSCDMAPILLVLGGLPAVGKTAIALELSRQLGTFHIRIDSIEQAMRASGAIQRPLDDAGYRVGYAVAADNLRLGLNGIADCVNPLNVTREAWEAVATQVGAIAVNVEIVCSDRQEHRRRVETRVADIPGLNLPTWDEVLARDYSLGSADTS